MCHREQYLHVCVNENDLCVNENSTFTCVSLRMTFVCHREQYLHVCVNKNDFCVSTRTVLARVCQ